MRKLLVSGLVVATAVLGCAGAALAEAGSTGTAGTTTVSADGPAGAAIARLASSASTADRVAAFRLQRLLAQRPQASATGSLYIAGGLSCGTVSDCLAIGMGGVVRSGPLEPAVERLHAGTWKSVPVKAPTGAVMTDLGSVSCRGPIYCLVVGQSLSDLPPVGGNGLTPLVLSWNGTALTRVAAPPVPKADALEEIFGVSCVTVGQCVVTGAGSARASGDAVQFVWTLNDATWKVTAITEPGTGGGNVPPPTGTGTGTGTGAGVDAATITTTTYEGLRCFALTSCVATGEKDVITNIGPGGSITTTPLAASWNGTAFTSLNAPAPSGTSGAMFNALSCVSPHACAVAGGAADSTSSNALGFAEVWNGKTWAVTKWAGPKGGTGAVLLGVSCTRADRCMAVGEHGSGTTSAPAALAWSGSKWKLLSVPGAGKGKTAVFGTVSCPISGRCVATGETGTMTKSSPNLVPLAGYWNHTAWTYGPMFPAA